MLGRDLRVLGGQRLVAGVDRRELQSEPLGVGEREAPVGSRDRDAFLAQAVRPEVERLLGRDPEHDAMHHARPRMPAPRAQVLEEGDVRARGAALVRVEQVVDGRVVLVDGLLDQAQAEHAHVEVDVARRVAGDRSDVVDSLEAHGGSLV